MPDSTMIYVTHDQVEAMTLADRIVVMRNGNIEQVGQPMELFQNPTNTFVAGFIGSPPMNLVPARIVSDDNRLNIRFNDRLSGSFRAQYEANLADFINDIRKDLDALADSGQVLRTHGGAIAPRVRGKDLAYDVRDRMQQRLDRLRELLARLEAGADYDTAYDHALTLYYVGRCMWAQGQTGQAIEWHRRALGEFKRLSGLDRTAKEMWGRAYADLGNNLASIAERHLERTIELSHLGSRSALALRARSGSRSARNPPMFTRLSFLDDMVAPSVYEQISRRISATLLSA